mgnify:CR=1 FL=1
MNHYWQMRSAIWWSIFKTIILQTEAVNDYLRSVYADGDGSMSERNCEHRRIASQKITIAAIPVLDNYQLDKLQNVLDHIAYDKEYYMPERGYGMHR